MSGYLSRTTMFFLFLSIVGVFSSQALAGGITLAGTRIIYPADQNHVSMSVKNTSQKSSFLVESWIERDNGERSQDIVVTPPLYVSAPGNENTLRLMYVGQHIANDRETLYYFNTKAIPSVDKKSIAGENILMLAAITRIKLFLRPDGLKPTINKAPEALMFNRAGNKIWISNPTPYYINLAQVSLDGKKLEDIMVSPKGRTYLSANGISGNSISFRTIDDYGALTPQLSADIR